MQYTVVIIANISQTFWNLIQYGDLQPLPEVDHIPQKEVPYPTSNGGQQFRRASGSCLFIPLHITCFGILVLALGPRPQFFHDAVDIPIFLLQNSIPLATCESVDFQTTILTNMRKQPDESGFNQNVSCCTNDGCNWNGTTAEVIETCFFYSTILSSISSFYYFFRDSRCGGLPFQCQVEASIFFHVWRLLR